MAALDGVKVKMARSREHIDSLRDEASNFVRDLQVRYRRERDDGPIKGWAFYVSWDKPVPDRFGAIIGDALTNMRAALDHLAWQLVSANGPEPTGKIYFPILSTPLERGKKLRFLTLIPAAAVPIIEAVQPYQNLLKGKPVEIHPLHVLGLLVNTDKHRQLTVTEMFGAESDIRITGPGGVPIYGRVETPGGVAGDEIGWLPDEVFDPGRRWEIFATIAPVLALDVGAGRMEPVIELLISMHDYVHAQVISPITAACF